MQLDLFAPRTETVFVRHRWARRYILRVLDDGRLRVTLPRWGSKKEAQAFVDRSGAWITRQLRKQLAAPPVVSGNEAELRARASKELPGRLIELARQHGISVRQVSIRNQRTRWGACSARGSITLNWRLVLVPDFVHSLGSPFQPARGMDRAARMRQPGAEISGFCRPSAVGPRLLKRAGGRCGCVASCAPTAMARKLLQMVLVV